MSSTLHLERRAQVLEGRRVVIEADADYVEAGVPVVPPARRDEVPGDARQLRLLPAVDGLERCAGTRSAPAPHLDEHDHAAIERDEIDLAGAAAVVARHDRVTLGAEKRLRHRLAFAPERA